MAANQKRRQRQLEKKRAKRRERHRLLVKQKNRGLAEQLSEAAARAPILDCFISEDVWEGGIGYAIISRELPHNQVAVANFLVDQYCLGVKNAFAAIMTKAEYENRLIGELEERFTLIRVTPPTARNFVEQAVEYARRLGLNPHQDYHRSKAIFGDIDPQQADEQFEFGQDGKPHFMAGPYDTPDRCYRILSILEHSCGRGGFHYTIPFMDALPPGLEDNLRLIGPDGDEWEFDDEDDEADEYDED